MEDNKRGTCRCLSAVIVFGLQFVGPLWSSWSAGSGFHRQPHSQPAHWLNKVLTLWVVCLMTSSNMEKLMLTEVSNGKMFNNTPFWCLNCAHYRISDYLLLSRRRVLGMSRGNEELRGVRRELALCLLASWAFCIFSIWNGWLRNLKWTWYLFNPADFSISIDQKKIFCVFFKGIKLHRHIPKCCWSYSSEAFLYLELETGSTAACVQIWTASLTLSCVLWCPCPSSGVFVSSRCSFFWLLTHT